MGIRFYCPNGHKLNVKEFQAGRRGVCPFCAAKVLIPHKSTRKSTRELRESGASDEWADAEATPATAQTSGQAATGRKPPPGPDEMDSGEGQVLQEARGDQPRRDGPAWQAAAEQATSPQATTGGQPSHGAQHPRAAGPGAAQPAAAQAPQTPPPVADPFLEAPSAVWYVCPPSGGQYGPAGADLMRMWLNEQRVTANALVWREGWPDWRPAGTVFPQLGAKTTAPSGDDGPASMPKTGGGPLVQPQRRTSQPRNIGRKKNDTQALIITALVVLVLLLGMIFVWVLQ